MNPILRSVLEKFVADAEKEAAGIVEMLNATPLSNMISLERETIEKVKKMTPAEANELLTSAIKERKRLMRLAKKQMDSDMLTERLVDLRYAKKEAEQILRYS
jgi:hypothetical protein